MYDWTKCPHASPMTPGHGHREIMPLTGPSPRAMPSANVLSLPHRKQWTEKVWSLISDLVTEEVKQAVIASNPDYLVSDDLSWLNEPIMELLGHDVDMRELLSERLSSSYEAIRAVHGTRANDLSSFYANGLVPMNPGVVENQAKSLFASGGFAAAANKLASAITEVDARDPCGARAGWLYFCADDRDLTSKGCGHYLVYGSEYLYCLGIRMIGSPATKRILKSIGRPTAFVVDIPISLIDRDTLEQLAGEMLVAVFNELLGIDEEPFELGFSISMQTPVGAKHIVGHYHPERVIDPLWNA